MKKNNVVKKFAALFLSCAMALSLAACSGGNAGTSNSSGSGNTSGSGNGDGYKIAVVRQLDHASMNEIRDAITTELDAKEKELGVEIEYKDFNGNNDTSTPAAMMLSFPSVRWQLSRWPLPPSRPRPR